jgi:hypothetical protein
VKDLKTFTDAAKLDILNLLSKDEPHIFEFRRAAEICGIASALCGASGTPTEQSAISGAIRNAEDKAPLLHGALLGRAFDGEAMLREKYDELKAHHTDLRRKALDIEEAREQVGQAHRLVEDRHATLRDYEASLQRERERLQLEADTKGVTLELPALPAPLGGEDEDAQDDER